MSSTSGGSRGGRRANSGRLILSPNKLLLRRKTYESQFKRIRLSKDIHSTWNTLKSSSSFNTDSSFGKVVYFVFFTRKHLRKFVYCTQQGKRSFKHENKLTKPVTWKHFKALFATRNDNIKRQLASHLLCFGKVYFGCHIYIPTNTKGLRLCMDSLFHLPFSFWSTYFCSYKKYDSEILKK